MGTAVSYALKYWPAILGGAVGYAAIGIAGIAVGSLLGATALAFVKVLRWGDAQRLREIKANEIAGHKYFYPAPPARFSRILLLLICFLGLAFVGYGYIAEFALINPSSADWMGATEPIARLFAAIIPAFDKMPEHLIEVGDARHAQAARHMLTLGWLFIVISIVATIFCSYLAVRSNETLLVDFRNLFPRNDRVELLKVVAGFAFLLLAAVLLLYFGWTGSRGLRGVRGRGLPIIAISAFCFMLVVMPPILACAVALQRRRLRREGIKQERASRGNLASLKSLFRKPRDKADAGSI